jgi:hypothetical protein
LRRPRTAKVGTWTNRDGDTRPSLSITAEVVLTVYQARKRRAAQGDDEAEDVSSPSPKGDRPATVRHAGRAKPLRELEAADGGTIAELENDVPF